MEESGRTAATNQGFDATHFYGRGRTRDYVTLLPPEDPVSDIGSSSDEDEQHTVSENSNGTPLPVATTFERNDEDREDDIPLSTLRHLQEYDSDDDDETPFAERLARITQKNAKYKWCKAKFRHGKNPTENNFSIPNEVQTPLQYFQKFFDREMLDTIVQQTNLYSTQVTGICINTSRQEICAFLGIHLFMGVVSMPSYLDYWATSTRYSKIADVMTLKRYQKLRRYIHFHDNTIQTDDRIAKIRPLLTQLQKNCQALEHENQCSVDEMMVPYKGGKAGSLRQYLPKKPKKWGFKFFVRSGVSGIVYDLFMYAGTSTFEGLQFSQEEEGFGLGAKAVVCLLKSVPHPQDTFIFFDNFFCSPDLIHYLKENKGINSLGTLRSDRVRGCILPTEKDLKKKGRGSYDVRVDNKAGVAIVRWLDSKPVTLASSFVADTPVTVIKRYSKEQKAKVDVPCPAVIKEYNKHMGGVDLSDMLIALYRTTMKSRRWYLGIFCQIIDIGLCNSWLLYRRDILLLQNGKHSPLKHFRMEVASALMNAGKKKGRPSVDEARPPLKQIHKPIAVRPDKDSRYDGLDHLPVWEKKGRCRNCPTGQTSVMCRKCRVRLCFVENRNCFVDFHVR